jgi:hypothetical protein
MSSECYRIADGTCRVAGVADAHVAGAVRDFRLYYHLQASQVA